MYNYRPVSLLQNLSKVLEKYIYNQIVDYFGDLRSQHKCSFRKIHSAQHCLLPLLDKRRDSVNPVLKLSTLLTNLLKSFDSLSTQCNSAKLSAYEFYINALTFAFDH